MGARVVGHGFVRPPPAEPVDDGPPVVGKPWLVTLLGTEDVLLTLAGFVTTVLVVVGVQGTLVMPVVFVIPVP